MQEIQIATLFGVFGLMFGSFVNVVVYRTPLIMEIEWLRELTRYLGPDQQLRASIVGAAGEKEIAKAAALLGKAIQDVPEVSLSKPASSCPSCKAPIKWRHNLPVAGWFVLGGKCSACKAPISPRYPLVEAAVGLVFAFAGYKFGWTAHAVLVCLATLFIVSGALVDLDTTYLPDRLTLPLSAIGLFGAWLNMSGVSLGDAALGLLFGYLALWVVATAFRLIRGIEGMAEGDFRMLAGIGALTGYQTLLGVVIVASLLGAIVGIYLMVAKKHKREVPIPFGPYLAVGGLAALFWRPQLAQLLVPV